MCVLMRLLQVMTFLLARRLKESFGLWLSLLSLLALWLQTRFYRKAPKIQAVGNKT